MNTTSAYGRPSWAPRGGQTMKGKMMAKIQTLEALREQRDALDEQVRWAEGEEARQQAREQAAARLAQARERAQQGGQLIESLGARRLKIDAVLSDLRIALVGYDATSSALRTVALAAGLSGPAQVLPAAHKFIRGVEFDRPPRSGENAASDFSSATTIIAAGIARTLQDLESRAAQLEAAAEGKED